MGCGCSPIISPEEFIYGTRIVFSKEYSYLFTSIVCPQEVRDLKDKVICEFQKIISELKKGHKPSLEFLLEEISAINLADEESLDRSKFVIQYYLNNQ